MHIMNDQVDVSNLLDILNVFIFLNLFDEKVVRLVSGALACSMNHGGVTWIADFFGLSRTTVTTGRDECLKLKENTKVAAERSSVENTRIRKSGGGRKSLLEQYPILSDIFLKVLSKESYGNPEKEGIYCNLGRREIARQVREEARKVGIDVNISHSTIGQWLGLFGYRRAKNKKLLQVGKPHPLAHLQMNDIHSAVQSAIFEGTTVLSVDCKNKITFGNYRAQGTIYSKEGTFIHVDDHDFADKKGAPFGLYDLVNNSAWIILGLSKDTPEFAVDCFEIWLKNNICNIKNNKILITCDGGGSNSYRSRMWKYKLAEVAANYGIEIHVMHYPRGKSKWNPIEHRVFCHVSRQMQGIPLTSVKLAMDVISKTKTSPKTGNGLEVKCVLNDKNYETGLKVSKDDFDNLDITYIGEVAELNYIIRGFKN